MSEVVKMGSNMELVPMTRQKHDPAWKHCEMYKNGDKVLLKCIYCCKIFKGGGIHRIKEHLAGQKGNGTTCVSVQPDVQLQMLENLNLVSHKKRKKQKLAEDMPSYNNAEATEVDVLTNSCELNTDITSPPVLDMLEQKVNLFSNRGDDVNNETDYGKEKEKVREASKVGILDDTAMNNHQAINSMRVNDTVRMAIGRFFFHVGLPLDTLKSNYFQQMVDAIATQGAGAECPTSHDIRSWILKNSIQEVRNDVDQCAEAWGKVGCSLLVEEWKSKNGKLYVNFLVYGLEGTVFLKSADISHLVDSTDAIYELLKEVVEEVGVRNVVQVVTSSKEQYAVAGKRLADTYPTLFWTPCATECIDLMLEDIRKLEWVSNTIEKAKVISRYIYTNSAILNMMRRYTFGVDLVDVGITCSATDFMILRRMVNLRHNLQSMFISSEWIGSHCSKTPAGYAMLGCVSNESFWSSCALITRLTEPLLRLLRIVGNAKRPGMGYVYGGLYRAKELIKKELVYKNQYLVFWNIIDRRWAWLQHHRLHAAGFYFNPKFFFSLEGDAHLHFRSLVFDCIEKLVFDPDIQDKIVKEQISYHNGAGDLGRKMAVRARDTLLPTEWWSAYGGGCQNLASLATRVLSQTCSLIRHKPIQISLDELHETGNCLEHQRLHDLVFMQYNMALKQMFHKDKEQDIMDPISYENSALVGDWVVEKERSSKELTSVNWMSIEPPSDNINPFGPPVDDIEALGAGFDDYEIFDGF